MRTGSANYSIITPPKQSEPQEWKATVALRPLSLRSCKGVARDGRGHCPHRLRWPWLRFPHTGQSEDALGDKYCHLWTTTGRKLELYKRELI